MNIPQFTLDPDTIEKMYQHDNYINPIQWRVEGNVFALQKKMASEARAKDSCKLTPKWIVKEELFIDKNEIALHLMSYALGLLVKKRF
jgi:hypothetical protein